MYDAARTVHIEEERVTTMTLGRKVPLPIIREVGHTLPVDWVEQVFALAERRAEAVRRNGAGPGSLTDEGLSYDVVRGDVIAEELPWLMAWYEGPALEVARRMFSEPELTVADHLPASININVQDGVGSAYEWHVDPSPYTALLGACDLDRMTGGSTRYEVEPSVVVDVYPRVGKLVGGFSEFPHSSEPLKVPLRRIVLPCLFYGPATPPRPAGLDEHVYS